MQSTRPSPNRWRSSVSSTSTGKRRMPTVRRVKWMQLHNGSEHFGKVANRGILERGCSYWSCFKHAHERSINIPYGIRERGRPSQAEFGIVLQTLNKIRDVQYIPTYVQCILSYFRIAQHRYVAASSNDLNNNQQMGTNSRIDILSKIFIIKDTFK